MVEFELETQIQDPATLIIKAEVKLERNRRDIKEIEKHLKWLDEISEMAYINRFSMEDGIIKAKSMLYDLLKRKDELIEYIDDLKEIKEQSH